MWRSGDLRLLTGEGVVCLFCFVPRSLFLVEGVSIATVHAVSSEWWWRRRRGGVGVVSDGS